MSVKQFFIKLAKDIKECFENACVCCSIRMAEESRIVPRSICSIENQVTNDMNYRVKPGDLVEVIVEDDELPCESYENDNNDDNDDYKNEDITEEILTDEVIVESIRSRKNRTPENNSPTQNDFVIIYHQSAQPLE